jgi:hypothetical protein
MEGARGHAPRGIRADRLGRGFALAMLQACRVVDERDQPQPNHRGAEGGGA